MNDPGRVETELPNQIQAIAFVIEIGARWGVAALSP
jgi:hypothetical protein